MTVPPLNKFICPVCGGTLEKNGNSLVCKSGHLFDISAKGYVNLVTGGARRLSGDGKELIRARERVMALGYYRSLYALIGENFDFGSGDVILDVGTGDGSFAGKLKELFPAADVIATDLAKHAIAHAAARYPGVAYAVANSARLPVADSTLSAVTAVFTSVFPAEIRRVLKKGGLFIKVTPAANHLLGLKKALYDVVRTNVEDESVPDGFKKRNTMYARDVYTARGEGIKDLVEMTPYSVKTAPARLKALYPKDELVTETEFRVDVYEKDTI